MPSFVRVSFQIGIDVHMPDMAAAVTCNEQVDLGLGQIVRGQLSYAII